MASNKDTDIYDSWEDIEDTSVLDRKLKEFLPVKQSSDTEKRFNGSGPVNMIMLGEDALRSQYVPPEPTVKILKRPTNGTAEKQMLNGDLKPRQPIKTLRQREQEYAEARLRILGEAKSPEESSESANKLLTGILRPSDLHGVIRLPKEPDGTKGFKVRR